MCHAVSTQSPDILFVVVQWSRFVCRYILSHTLSPTSPKASSCRAYRWLHCHMLGGCQNWEYRSALPKLTFVHKSGTLNHYIITKNTGHTLEWTSRRPTELSGLQFGSAPLWNAERASSSLPLSQASKYMYNTACANP